MNGLAHFVLVQRPVFALSAFCYLGFILSAEVEKVMTFALNAEYYI